MHRFLIPILLLLTLTACSPIEQPSPTPNLPPTIAPITLSGQVEAWGEGSVIEGRSLVLCAMDDANPRYPLDCTLTGDIAIVALDGIFTFTDIPQVPYAILYDSGLSDFAAWQGETITIGDWDWTRDTYLQLGEGESPNLRLPDDLPDTVNRPDYALQTLLFEDSPLILAHILRGNDPFPVIADLSESSSVEVSFPVFSPQPIDHAAIRESVGLLSHAELPLFDREIVDRWGRFSAGDDSLYRDLDHEIILRLREGNIHPIANTFIMGIEQDEDDLLKQIAYGVIDPQSGEKRLLARLDSESGEVIEESTGYKLRVLDDPGEWIEAGPNGEQFYHYGFTYYRNWDRILPSPFVAIAQSFYMTAPDYVRFYLDDYQRGAARFGGDMALLDWNSVLPQQVADFQPGASPHLLLPDSGKVDVRRDRFLQAVAEGQVVVDQSNVDDYISSDAARTSVYAPDATIQEITDALLTPYRSGHLFNDMEAAIILEATYGRNDPLTIRITSRLRAGFSIPRRGTNEIFIAQNEVANVILGYSGTLNARWAHEMGHILDFRDSDYGQLRRDGGDSRCEPFKYLIEYMWWVERYPFDAPDGDWLPISSGLTLSRLLTGTYPNSGC